MDFLETDITGPVPIRRYTSARFMIHIYYNTTKKSEIGLLKYKDKLSVFIQRFIDKHERLYLKVYRIKINNKSEYTSSEFIAYYDSKGIIYEYIIPGNP
jgi:hypothetical protein